MTDFSEMAGAALRTDLECILTLPSGFGLATASPLQRALCRIADGVPLGSLAEHPDVASVVRGARLPDRPPSEVYVVSGVRCGKSLLAAAKAVQASQTVDMGRVPATEAPARFSIVSLKLDLAKVPYQHLVGGVLRSFRHLLVGEPTSDSVTLLHPSGRRAEVRVVAGAAAGGSLIARWSTGAVFDEAGRMHGADSAVVNFEHSRQAILGRLLPGAQLWAITSPHAPFGPIYQACATYCPEPSSMAWVPSKGLFIMRAPANLLNPYWWTAKRVRRLQEKDQGAYRTDVLGEFLDPESSLFTSAEIAAATRSGPLVLEPEPRRHYVAVMDPATRGNAWTLVVLSRSELGTVQVARCEQWQGDSLSPLSAEETLRKAATILRPYRCDRVVSDQWAADPLKELARQQGLTLTERRWTQTEKLGCYETLRALMGSGQLELPPDELLRQDLLRVMKRVTATGVAIHEPVTSDGRHCDYAAALALSTMVHCPVPDVAQERPRGWEQWELDEAERYAAELRRARGDDDEGDEMDYEELDDE